VNPARFQSFAEAYITALVSAVEHVKPFLQSGETAEQYALDTALVMLEQLQRKGIDAIAPYLLNIQGGALSATCAALGVLNTSRAIDNYLGEV
jgi:hypothetical protein